MNISDLKAAVDTIGRKRVAKLAGFSYSQVNSRLNEFLQITEEEEARLLAAVAECNKIDNTVGEYDNGKSAK